MKRDKGKWTHHRQTRENEVVKDGWMDGGRVENDRPRDDTKKMNAIRVKIIKGNLLSGEMGVLGMQNDDENP